MEAADLRKLDPAERLMADPNSFGFFQAVRLLERTRPGRSAVGGFADPADEVARFAVPPSLAYPASEIQELEDSATGPTRMWVNFFGLTGPLGVLPYHYTQLVAERAREKDPAMRDFFDLFHHRLISLFYRAWEKYRFPVAYERDKQDRLSEHLGDLVGLPVAKPNERSAVKREALLFYAGLIASRQRSSQALQAMLEDYFGVPVEVEQFVGAWYPVSAGDLCRLDDDEVTAGPSVLGGGCPVGDEIWDQQARVRLRIGPLRRAQYDQFLPRGSAFKALRELTQLFGGDGFDFEVQLVLDRRDVPPTVLGADRDSGMPLSWGTWLCTAPFDRDPDDTILIL
jgi:type VI secretion system protein ImpH